MRRITLPCDDRPDNQPATLEKGKGKIQQWQVPSFSTVTTPIRSFLCSSSPPPVAFAHSDPPLGAHICDKSGEPAELHSGHGHGAQIHRWSNVCRSQEGLRSQLGLRKHHCWEEKVESSSLHTLALPTLASLAFPCTKIFTMHCVQVLIIRQRLSECAIACRLLVI